MVFDSTQPVQATAALVADGAISEQDRREILYFTRFLREVGWAPLTDPEFCPTCTSRDRDQHLTFTGHDCPDPWHQGPLSFGAWEAYIRGIGKPPAHELNECQAYCYQEYGEEWMKSGLRQPGEEIECICSNCFVHVCEESSGCSWALTEPAAAPSPTDQLQS